MRFITNGQHIIEEVHIRLPPKNKCDNIVTLPRIGVHSIENALIFVLSGILFRGPRLILKIFRRCVLDVKSGTQEHLLVPIFNHASFHKLRNSNKFKISWKAVALVRAKEFEFTELTESTHDVLVMESSSKGNKCSSEVMAIVPIDP